MRRPAACCVFSPSCASVFVDGFVRQPAARSRSSAKHTPVSIRLFKRLRNLQISRSRIAHLPRFGPLLQAFAMRRNFRLCASKQIELSGDEVAFALPCKAWMRVLLSLFICRQADNVLVKGSPVERLTSGAKAP